MWPDFRGDEGGTGGHRPVTESWCAALSKQYGNRPGVMSQEELELLHPLRLELAAQQPQFGGRSLRTRRGVVERSLVLHGYPCQWAV